MEQTWGLESVVRVYWNAPLVKVFNGFARRISRRGVGKFLSKDK
ncbi:MAG: hypothetical protein QNJ64_09905 [Crocosphaera sp.]|nr:hypothetical protein [Crocosphaera sp.]